MREVWSAKLRVKFPDRAVMVSFPDEDLPDLLDYEITVFQAPANPS
jgi:hypothetical protein